MMKISSEKTTQLHDGRTLGFVDYGNPTGQILFYFHGHPGSRLEAKFLADEPLKAGIHLIGVDRPGMGLSAYKIVLLPTLLKALCAVLGAGIVYSLPPRTAV